MLGKNFEQVQNENLLRRIRINQERNDLTDDVEILFRG